ncbi:MAG: LysR family transcriptional regulator [Rhodocyclaceae bacterium]|nr:LysR family transcriptional regulator [Rhodocyclaceae bacterium]
MIEAIRVFVRVVDAGSFSAAAELLGRNPSSLTRRIDQLEHELGAKLMIRSTRRLELTADGEQFYSQALEVLASLEAIQTRIGRRKRVVGGHLAINAFDTYGRETLVPLLPRFRALYPDATVSLSLDNQLVDLYQSPFDVAIRFGRPSDSGLCYRPLHSTTAVLMASPAYLQRHPPPEVPGDLCQHDCLAFFRQRQYTYWHFSKGDQRQKVRIKPVLSSPGGTPLLLWCREGQGVALLNRYFVDKDLLEGRLVALLPDWQASLTEHPTGEIYMVWTAAAATRPLVRAFIDFMVAERGS